MPIVIAGLRGITSTLDTGEFYCPQCDAREEYTLKQSRPFFTFFFIPIFPVGRAQRYVECQGCRQAFSEEVLQYEPPSEAERLLGQFFEELKTGTSVEVIEQKLINHGMEPDRATEVLEQMCGSRPRQCVCGQHFHPSVIKCSHCGSDL
jgi:hypothetical protein